MTRNAIVAGVCAWVLSTSTSLQATTTWYVDINNAKDPMQDGSATHPFDAIQEAVDAAANGDIVLVLPGTYFGFDAFVDFTGKAIEVVSRDGPAVTILDGIDLLSLVTFNSGEGRDSILRGFTLRNGRGTGNGTFDQGGGVNIELSSPTVVGNVIINNRAHFGGGVYTYQGNPLILNNIIMQNSVVDSHLRHIAGDGGGIWVYDSSAEIYGNLIVSNQAQRQGGGIGVEGGRHGEFFPMNVVIANNVIAGNSVLELGGGAISLSNRGQILIRGCTMTANSAPFGGGLYHLNVNFDTQLSSTVINSVLYGNHGSVVDREVVVGQNSSATVAHCDVEGGLAGTTVSGGGSLTWGPGNINAIPQFIGAGDYRVRPCSPLVNAGDPSYVPPAGETDVYGGGRVFGDRVDIGAAELVYHDCNADGAPDECTCPADLNHDCAVSLSDLTVLLSHFGTASGAMHSDGDLDGDGDVDLSDLTLFLARFGQSC